ncbi:MlaD family protein [Nocardia sp. NPDC004582]
MPTYGMPGVPVDRRRSLLIGVGAAATVALMATAATGYHATRPEDGMRVALYTEQIGDGIDTGSRVSLDGVAIGRVDDISPGPAGTQRITLRLTASRLHGLDDSLRVDYAPENLFGISEIELRRGPGGQPLRPGAEIHLTGARAADVYDATMGSLLRSMSTVSTAVLTPQLSTLIDRLATDLRAFTPFLQSMVSMARVVADNQRLQPAQLLGRFGDALGPTSELVDATVSTIDHIYRIEDLRTDRTRIDAGLNMVITQLFPTLTSTLFHAATFSGFTDMLAPLLTVLAQMVPAPQRSGAEIAELLTRLRDAMPDTPSGPVLNLDVELSGVPAVAVPLLGGAR